MAVKEAGRHFTCCVKVDEADNKAHEIRLLEPENHKHFCRVLLHACDYPSTLFSKHPKR